jgi:hypothetical protein
MSDFSNYKKFENVGIRSSNDTLIVMDSSNNNISLHSSDGGDDNVDTVSIKNIINKTPNMDLNLSSLNGTTINPVITINNNNQDCRINTNLNVSGNLNITGGGTVTADTFNGALSGLATYATNANGIYGTFSSSNNNYPLTFWNNTSLSSGNKNLLLDNNNKLTFNPSSGQLYCTKFKSASGYFNIEYKNSSIYLYGSPGSPAMTSGNTSGAFLQYRSDGRELILGTTNTTYDHSVNSSIQLWTGEYRTIDCRGDGAVYLGCQVGHGTTIGSGTAAWGLSTLNICCGKHSAYSQASSMGRWSIGCQNSGNLGADNDLYFTVYYEGSGTTRNAGWIQDGNTNVRMNFTGQHRCVPENSILLENVNDYVGLLVESTGKYDNILDVDEDINNRHTPTINECQPIVSLCKISKSKKVFGVISAKEESKRSDKPFTRYFGVGFMMSCEGLPEQNTPRLFINSLGEGGVKVCNQNGDIENGDLLCSSDIEGYAMKQDDDILRNYTVGKATMDYKFNNNERPLIGCVYYCG